VERQPDELWWWTWADGHGNASLATALADVVDIRSHTGTIDCDCAEVDSARLRTALDSMMKGELPRPRLSRKQYGTICALVPHQAKLAY
jgi:hypothetical protein